MKNEILLYIEQPPPMHGMTYINKIIYDSLKNEDEFHFFDTNFSLDVGEVGNKSFKKIVKNLLIMFGAWKSFFNIKPDVVYSIASASLFGIVRDFMIILPAILFQKNLVLHLHGFTYYKIYESSKIYKSLFDIMSKNATLVVLCEKQKEITLNIMSKDSVVLYNCLNNENHESIKKKNNILTLCYISNISKEKGTFDLVKAVQKYQKKIKLIIAGNFLSDKDEFLELIKKSDNIEYIGFADEKKKQEILQTSDIFCLPSKLEEGSPISIIEAMSYGLPIIASDKGCIQEMINNSGYLLESNYTINDIVDGINLIDENYIQLSKKTKEIYIKKYSKVIFITDLKLILKENVV